MIEARADPQAIYRVQHISAQEADQLDSLGSFHLMRISHAFAHARIGRLEMFSSVPEEEDYSRRI
jgi:hypothetical protein